MLGVEAQLTLREDLKRPKRRDCFSKRSWPIELVAHKYAPHLARHCELVFVAAGVGVRAEHTARLKENSMHTIQPLFVRCKTCTYTTG